MNPHLKTARYLSKLLDNQFSIFGYQFGLDPILGLIPWAGDTISFFLSLYIIWIAHTLKVPPQHLQKMIGHVLLDYIIGLIPIVGEISDFFYKANQKNLEILNRYAAPDEIEGEIVES